MKQQERLLHQRKTGPQLALGDACSPNFFLENRAGKRAGVEVGSPLAQQLPPRDAQIRLETWLQHQVELLSHACFTPADVDPLPASVVDVIRYIHGEMMRNEEGSDVRHIRDLLKIDALDVLVAGT